VFPGQPPRPPEHGTIDDYDLPALYLSPEFDASTLHARFLRHAWARFPLVRTILDRPNWLAELWDDLRSLPLARVLIVQPGPAAELSDHQLIGGRRIELTMLETDAHARVKWEPAWRERWPGRAADLTVEGRPPTGIPASRSDSQPYDLIYGAGVLSGLQSPDARALAKSLFGRLRPGGRMVLGNLMAEPATSWLLEYVLGWRLVYRDTAQMEVLATELRRQSSRCSVESDPTGRAVVLDVVR